MPKNLAFSTVLCSQKIHGRNYDLWTSGEFFYRVALLESTSRWKNLRGSNKSYLKIGTVSKNNMTEIRGKQKLTENWDLKNQDGNKELQWLNENFICWIDLFIISVL
jgi:hypothetical protein